MIILSIRSDDKIAEVGLFKDYNEQSYIKWEAFKQLSATLHLKVKELLKKQNLKLSDLDGIIVYQGPGSFTGLRIGISAANSLSYALDIPIIAQAGEDWIRQSIKKLISGENAQIAMPEYGAPPHITVQKK